MVRAEQGSAASHATDMETLEGFPNLPAMVRAEQGSAASHATDMETLEGFSKPSRDGPAEQGSAASHATRRGWSLSETRTVKFFRLSTDGNLSRRPSHSTVGLGGGGLGQMKHGGVP